jgi:tetratricopeptide (TPR) repeat protein
MTLNRLNPLALIPVAVAFVAAALVFGALDGSKLPAAERGASAAPAPLTTDARIATLKAAVRDNPRDTGQLALLADAYLQKARETGDGAFYTRADEVLQRARRIDPRDSAVYTELSTLELARHHFRTGLAYGRRAHALAPAVVKPLGVIVDAQVELGRYDDAARTLQAMLDEKPSLASYARLSYFRELHGDLPGALRAMRLAVSAGGSAPENSAYVQSLLGALELNSGNLDAAEDAYRLALSRVPGYGSAEAGLARVEIARGRLDAALARLRPAAARLETPELLTLLAETELATGRPAAARRHVALVRAGYGDLAANGENTATELAVIEADHGSPRRAVALGRRAWRVAPSVRSADALGWALTSAGRPRAGYAWARRALRLGSREPVWRYHAGMSALAAGKPRAARRHLTVALSGNPRFSPLYAPRAKAALERLRRGG